MDDQAHLPVAALAETRRQGRHGFGIAQIDAQGLLDAARLLLERLHGLDAQIDAFRPGPRRPP